jgi:hypothetical protein
VGCSHSAFYHHISLSFATADGTGYDSHSCREDSTPKCKSLRGIYVRHHEKAKAKAFFRLSFLWLIEFAWRDKGYCAVCVSYTGLRQSSRSGLV